MPVSKWNNLCYWLSTPHKDYRFAMLYFSNKTGCFFSKISKIDCFHNALPCVHCNVHIGGHYVKLF